ncbi:PadR family transcriptional regulator [Micromonospora pisi]|uniref:PadR family transcriptional regulator n=2 Tax=Micromonospora pisi TaxID=589240 RepID=A0A495JGM3_9ACTN|nr:PadR family transcriptional regulator [Micromonospora pisi]
MREPTFMILTALVEGPQHGYAILTEVRRISGGRVELRAGTLYAVLDRLRADGLAEVEREELVQSRMRRYYRLTALGVRRLAEETSRLRDNAEAATVRLRRAGLLLEGGAA